MGAISTQSDMDCASSSGWSSQIKIGVQMAQDLFGCRHDRNSNRGEHRIPRLSRNSLLRGGGIDFLAAQARKLRKVPRERATRLRNEDNRPIFILDQREEHRNTDEADRAGQLCSNRFTRLICHRVFINTEAADLS